MAYGPDDPTQPYPDASSNMFRGGGYGGGQSSINANRPPNAVDPGMWARLMGFAGGLSPIGSARAGGVQAPDSPEARQAAIAAAAAQLNNGGPGAQPPGPQGPAPPPGITAVNPPFPHNILPGPQTGPAGPVGNLPPPPAAIAAASQSGSGYGAIGPQGWGVTAPNGGYNAGAKRTDAAYGPYDAPAPAASAAPVPGPLAQDGRFGTFKYETPNSSASRAPIYTSLNLGGLFGGGQPAAPAAPPKAKIDVGKIPANARAEVPPSKRSKVKSDMGPLQKGWTWGGKDYNPDLYR